MRKKIELTLVKKCDFKKKLFAHWMQNFWSYQDQKYFLGNDLE